MFRPKYVKSLQILRDARKNDTYFVDPKVWNDTIPKIAGYLKEKQTFEEEDLGDLRFWTYPSRREDVFLGVKEFQRLNKSMNLVSPVELKSAPPSVVKVHNSLAAEIIKVENDKSAAKLARDRKLVLERQVTASKVAEVVAKEKAVVAQQMAKLEVAKVASTKVATSAASKAKQEAERKVAEAKAATDARQAAEAQLVRAKHQEAEAAAKLTKDQAAKKQAELAEVAVLKSASKQISSFTKQPFCFIRISTKYCLGQDCLPAGFEILQQIGEGQYGNVFRVRYQGKIYALKILLLNTLIPTRACDIKEPTEDECAQTTTKEFNHEVEMAKQLGDAGISPTFYKSWICSATQSEPDKIVDVGMYLTQEYGVSLEKWQATYGDPENLTKKEVDIILGFQDVIKQKLATIGLTNRDLHSGNILVKVDAQGIPSEPKVIDTAQIVPITPETIAEDEDRERRKQEYERERLGN